MINKFFFLVRLVDPIVDIRKFIFAVPRYISFIKDLFLYKKLDKRYSLKLRNIYPQIHDKTTFTGFDRHYIYHTAWAARIIKEINPDIHMDISSSLYFCSIASAFIPIKFYDYRPAKIELSNLTTGNADLLNLSFESNSIISLSCMHTVEHVGLGRYGDPIDSEGDLKAIKELKRVLAVDGNLLFVVPVGKPKLMYNAHRIYSYDEILGYFNDFFLNEFSLIPDEKELGFIYNATKEIADAQEYGCGCFWFRKQNKS